MADAALAAGTVVVAGHFPPPKSSPFQIGDYQYFPHIMRWNKQDVLLVRRHAVFVDGSLWEAVPLSEFRQEPLAGLIRVFDPTGGIRRPASDHEHEALLKHFDLIGR